MADVEPTVDELNAALEQELREWDKIGVAANSIVKLDPMEITFKFNALVQILQESGVVDEDKFAQRWKMLLLDFLKTVRPDVANRVAEHRRGLSVVERRLLGPNGEPMH
jgi:hypothetical protein